MGTRQVSIIWETQLWILIACFPRSQLGGIFDFSGTQADHKFCWTGATEKAGKAEPTKDEVANWTKFWWDGSSDDWTTDQEFQDKRNEFNEQSLFTVGGNEYRIMWRIA